MATNADVDFYLRLSEIFAVIFVGFGAMMFSLMEITDQSSIDSLEYIKDLAQRNITNIIPVEVPIAYSNLKKFEIYNNLQIPILVLFFISFMLTIGTLLYACHLRGKLKTETI